MEAIVKDRDNGGGDLHGEHASRVVDKLEVESRAKQEAFINGIASKLERPVTEKPNHPFRGAPDFWNAFEWPIEERIERFARNFQSAGGHVVRLATMEDAKFHCWQSKGDECEIHHPAGPAGARRS